MNTGDYKLTPSNRDLNLRSALGSVKTVWSSRQPQQIGQEPSVFIEKPIKNATLGVNQGGVSVLRVGIQQREKQGENCDLLEGGAPGGATWGEIRGLIARCEDLPVGIREQLVTLGDRCQVELHKVSPSEVG